MGLLENPSTLVILTYAMAGLGHLRVTDALKHGLPKHARVVLYHSEDHSLTAFHQIVSTHPLVRTFSEWVQWGPLEGPVTTVLRSALRNHTSILLKDMTLLVQSQEKPVQTVVMVATHFGLAHQMVAIKSAVEKKCKVHVVVVVQVTDDSPQDIWYVEGADLLVVPSETTKSVLEEYGRGKHFSPVSIVVLPYPVSPQFSKALSVTNMHKRLEQLESDEHAQLHVMIPISGAAVGLRTYDTFIHRFHTLMPRTNFQIVTKESMFTKAFIKSMQRLQYATLHTGKKDSTVVDLYEHVYKELIIGLEITKPSEQAFKALLSPKTIGGSLLLFSRPVGRQEYDNLAFLRRHELIPTQKEQRLLWSISLHQSKISEHILEDLKRHAQHWRGLRLMDHPEKDALFIRWCIRSGMFTAMMQYTVRKRQGGKYHAELDPRGVEFFWKMVDRL